MTPKDSRPEIEQRARQTYIGRTETVTMATISRAADRIPEIVGWLGEHGAAPAGAPFLRYRIIDMEGTVVVEAGVPVDDSVSGSTVDQSDLELQSLPAGRYVTLTHHGHVDQLKDANAALMTWAAEHDIAWDMSIADDGQHWACRLETYLTNPSEQPDPNQWRTLIAMKTT
jgi:effector-binding domain-containing protein